MRIPWQDAARTLDAMLPAHQPAAIAIAGAPGSGKSTLATALAALRGDAVVIGTDAYLPDYSTLEPHQFDLPEHSALDELAEHIVALLAGQAAQVPVWCFHEHRRTTSRRVEPASLIVIEGIHALQPMVAAQSNLRVLIDAPSDDRLERILARERAGERGWGEEQSTAFFHAVADPTFGRFLPEYRALADVTIDNPGRPG
jgi:uridine kinase